MIGYFLTLATASALSPGTAELTFDGETTSHHIAACSLEAQDAMPPRLLIQDTDVTLNVSRVDHMQVISVIRNNANWSATRMFIGGQWLDGGQPSEPIVSEWGDMIRVQATLTTTSGPGEKPVTLIANCRG